MKPQDRQPWFMHQTIDDLSDLSSAVPAKRNLRSKSILKHLSPILFGIFNVFLLHVVGALVVLFILPIVSERLAIAMLSFVPEKAALQSVQVSAAEKIQVYVEPSDLVVDEAIPEKNLPQDILLLEQPKIILGAQQCNLPMMRTALLEGESINTRDAYGDTALIWAAKMNCKVGGQLLIKNGADSAIYGRSGFTAAEWARRNNSFDLLKILG